MQMRQNMTNTKEVDRNQILLTPFTSELRDDYQLEEFSFDYHEILECITSALDARDPHTADHSFRVSEMAERLCRLIGLKEADTDKIHVAAHLHDIGKIGIPDSILYKEGPLNDYEWEIMKQHPSIGADILLKSERLSEISYIVKHHHERFDGRGYPDGIKAENIPIGSRIIAICDSIDAMTTKRSYRDGKSFDFAYGEIERNLGTMYDPLVGKYVLMHWEDIITFSN
jgi:putative nucleotidyltransferase with HDIG domain